MAHAGTVSGDLLPKIALVKRFRDLLADGGYLFLGHSESVVGGLEGFKACGRTVYQKVPAAEAAA